MNDKLQKDAEKAVLDAWTLFQAGLINRGPYPMRELELLFAAVTSYTKAMSGSEFIHKSIAGALRSFGESLELERKRVPGSALALADRLECILFDGYDPYSEGDAPPDR
jgi:hypothetical protein